MASIAPFARRLKGELQTSGSAIELLPPADVEAACVLAGHRWRRCFWTPPVTLLTFLRQVLHGNCSCRQAVALTLTALSGAASADPEDEMSGEPSACYLGTPCYLGTLLSGDTIPISMTAGRRFRGSQNRTCGGPGYPHHVTQRGNRRQRSL